MHTGAQLTGSLKSTVLPEREAAHLGAVEEILEKRSCCQGPHGEARL